MKPELSADDRICVERRDHHRGTDRHHRHKCPSRAVGGASGRVHLAGVSRILRGTSSDVYTAPAPVYIMPALAVIAILAFVVEYIATSAVSFVAPAPVVHAATPFFCGVHRASACCDRDTCASGRVHRASTSHVSHGTSSRRVHRASTRGGVHHASASRNCGTCIRGRVHRDRACLVIRGASFCRVRDTSTRSRVHRASVSRLLRGASSSCARCDSICGRVHCVSASSVLRSTGSSCACRACATCGAHRASVSGSVPKASGIKQTQHSDFARRSRRRPRWKRTTHKRSCRSSPRVALNRSTRWKSCRTRKRFVWEFDQSEGGACVRGDQRRRDFASEL